MPFIKIPKKETIKNNLSQITALTELNLKLNIRYKFGLILSYINPLISIIFPFIILGSIFQFTENFGPWTPENYLVFIFTGYSIILLKNIIEQYPKQMLDEKYWKTLKALLIAPFHRINLLLGTFITQIILLSFPFFVFLIICFILFPVSLTTLLFILLIYFFIALIFGGIGLIISVFAISKENIWYMMAFSINILFWFSCITYPFQLFPPILQNFIRLNPLYYIFDFLRYIWIEDDVIFSIVYHPRSFVVLVICSLTIPIIGVYIFNKVYKRYGISGY